MGRPRVAWLSIVFLSLMESFSTLQPILRRYIYTYTSIYMYMVPGGICFCPFRVQGRTGRVALTNLFSAPVIYPCLVFKITLPNCRANSVFPTPTFGRCKDETSKIFTFRDLFLCIRFFFRSDTKLS